MPVDLYALLKALGAGSNVIVTFEFEDKSDAAAMLDGVRLGECRGKGCREARLLVAQARPNL